MFGPIEFENISGRISRGNIRIFLQYCSFCYDVCPTDDVWGAGVVDI